MKKHVNSKVNKKFRVKNKGRDNPEESQQIKSTYLNHVINYKEIANQLPLKRQQSSAFTTKAQTLSKNQKDKQFSSFRNANSVLSPIKNIHDPSKYTFRDKNAIIINQELLRKKEFQPPTNEKINELIKNNKRAVVHLNYVQYQKIMGQQQIKPTYFEQLGKKNDQKYQNNQQEDKNTRIKDLLYIENFRQHPVKLNKNIRHIKTEISERKEDQPAKTLISCAIGALSTYQIKQQLQQKWEEEERIKRIKSNNFIFTEDSDAGSECDKKQYTQTIIQDVNLIGISSKKQKSPKVIDERKQVEWDKIQNQNFKEILKKILQIRKKTLSKIAQPEFSNGEQYETKEESMTTIRDVYKPKKFIMKHKLQWHV